MFQRHRAFIVWEDKYFDIKILWSHKKGLKDLRINLKNKSNFKKQQIKQRQKKEIIKPLNR